MKELDDLLKNRARVTEETKHKKTREKIKKTVAYSMDGKVIKDKLSKKGKAAVIAGSVVLCLVAAVYVPPLFYHTASDNSNVPITPDVSAIKIYQTYLKDHPDADFDKDGLSNAMEAENGTDP